LAHLLSGIRLVSDRQPDRLRVDDQTSGPPHIWLHADNPTAAWIVVDFGTRAWSQLAYQFGHELGHVRCNSWMWKVETPPPSRWLEECLAEALHSAASPVSLTGGSAILLFPTTPHTQSPCGIIDATSSRSIERPGEAEGGKDMSAWPPDNRKRLDETTGLGVYTGPAILAIVTAMEDDKGCVEDLGAVNRWPERSGVALEDYLRL
jgi:hypothetical protein